MLFNISIFFSWICLFLSVTDMQIVQLQAVPNPCPSTTPQSTIADMCTTNYAAEEDNNYGTTADSVALRVMTQQDGCTCEVKLQNQMETSTLYMRKYDKLTKAAPEQETCGVVIDIDYNIPNNLPETKVPVECTKGTDVRSISLSQNSVLSLRSRVIDGTFARGYCMQIYRQHQSNDTQRVEIHCSNATKSQQDTQETETDSTLYVAIGVGSVVMVITLFVVVGLLINLRRRGNKDKYKSEIQPGKECTDYDSDGLKCNTLYNSSEQQEIMEGNYHTVDGEGEQNITGIQKNLGTDYSTVDGNYSSIDIVNIHAKDGSKDDNSIMSRSNTQRPKEETSNNLKHVTAGSNVEYAVVDKNGRTHNQNIKHVTAPNDSNVEYAVIDKK